MPLNITVHSSLSAPQGVQAPAPTFDNTVLAQVVALGAASALIAGPALICLIADEDQRVGISLNSPYAAPSASGLKLKAGVERYFNIAANGPWYISCVAG